MLNGGAFWGRTGDTPGCRGPLSEARKCRERPAGALGSHWHWADEPSGTGSTDVRWARAPSGRRGRCLSPFPGQPQTFRWGQIWAGSGGKGLHESEVSAFLL